MIETVLVLDSETTGVDHTKDRVVEIAGVEVDVKKKRVTTAFDALVNPGIPIPPVAMGIHHILDKDVRRKPDLASAIELWIKTRNYPFTPAAHNAEFDRGFLPVGTDDWICTWRCANHIWPGLSSYSNQSLRYQLKLFREPEERAMPPHRAPADAWVTAHILIRMLKENYSADRLLELTKSPILLRTVHFGAHRGKKWSEVPRDYLRWVLSRPDFNSDVVHTARHHYG